jgi:hypothetical protein
MEYNASTNNASGSVAESGPQIPSEETQRKRVFPLRTIVLIVSSLLIMVVIVAGVYFFVNRTNSVEEATASVHEYQNPNGFKISYSDSSGVSETTEGVTVSGATDLSFVVNTSKEPLADTVAEIAENFGGNQEALETYTINERVGFMMDYQNNRYYYFPLVGDYYLEIVDRKPDSEANKKVLDTLVFTPPQARLN